VTQPQRRGRRIQPFVVACRYVVGEQRFPGFLTDISRGGGRVHTDSVPPVVGALVAIEARLVREAVPVRLPATVRWVGPGTRGGSVFGVSFDEVGADERAVLESAVAEFERRAASIG
jgi:hypothetical protein